MRDVLDDLAAWWSAGVPVGMATVVATWRSAPRPPGAVLLVGPDGTAVGSISGGCVEGAVYDLARDAAAGAPPRLQRYGVSDDDAFAVGLSCGGVLDVFVDRVDQASFPQLPAVARAIRADSPVAIVTCVASSARGSAVDGEPLGRRLVVWTDRTDGTLRSPGLDEAATNDARDLLAHGRSGTRTYGHDHNPGGAAVTVFVAAYPPRPRMIVFGAVDFAIAVARVGSFLGYHVTVCDARGVFATPRRFPDADAVVVDWPHRYLGAEADAGRVDARTVVCVLTHDPRFDDPLLQVALRLDLGYVGAMGSRRTHDQRMARLRTAGVGPTALARLASPIGLDLGAATPEETAVSIAAEIVASRQGGTGERLTRLHGRIHHPPGTTTGGTG